MNSIRHLVELFAPEHYEITLDLSQRLNRKYTGKVLITGKLIKNASEITVHSKDLTITSAQVDGAGAKFSSSENDELTITTPKKLAPGEHKIYIEFTGEITDQMHGIYPCYFKEGEKSKELLMTQFESHSAREALPCVDEPAAKATFSLNLVTEPGITLLGNMPVKTQTPENKNTVTTSFETTPKMSTYLLAFVVGDLKFKEKINKHGVTVRAYATPEHYDELDFAANHAAKTLDFYDDYFNEPYPLPKCDLVACPDFAAGAMENWGLITFREAALLVDKNDTPADNVQRVAEVIGHELAHQWFGNLVTMQWWDDLWLNESFANWMECYSTAHFYPEWQMWEQYSATEQQMAFSRDSLASVQAVQQHINHPDEIASLFDPAIVYAKGGSLIRMLNEHLGDATFREGLRIYMKRHKYGNTTTEDLWKALEDASGRDVKSFMRAWITQPGHPIVTCRIKDEQAKISQQRFFVNPQQAKEDDESIWPIPLLSTTIASQDLLNSKSATLRLKPANYHLINHGGTGFYHVNYDSASNEKIAQAVQSKQLSVTDRQRVLMDSVALNRAGVEPTLTTLKFLDRYSDESNYAVWLAINTALGALRMLVRDDPEVKPHLKKFVADLSRSQYNRLGWDVIPNESHFDTLLRPFALANMAFSRDPEITLKCVEQFNKANKPEDLTPDIRSIIYSVAVRADSSAVDKLMDWYRTTQTADERLNICAGVTSVRDPQRINDLLSQITTKNIKLQDAFYWYLYFLRSSHARAAAWQWMINNWAWIKKNYEGDSDYGYFAKYPGHTFSNASELEKYKAFFESKVSEPALARTIKQGYEDIETKILWRERDFKEIANYLASRQL